MLKREVWGFSQFWFEIFLCFLWNYVVTCYSCWHRLEQISCCNFSLINSQVENVLKWFRFSLNRHNVFSTSTKLVDLKRMSSSVCRKYLEVIIGSLYAMAPFLHWVEPLMTDAENARTSVFCFQGFLQRNGSHRSRKCCSLHRGSQAELEIYGTSKCWFFYLLLLT